MIHTVYPDSKTILDTLEKYRRASPAHEEDLLKLSAFADDLGITVCDTRAEFDEVFAKIPEHIFRGAKEIEGSWVMFHRRTDDSPPGKR